MDYIDLHTHTTYSDGTYTPKELMAYAAEKNLKAIAVTDHDTVDSYEESAFWAKHYGIELIPGVEIDSMYNGTEIHILGLFIDPTNNVLLTLLNDMKRMRYERDAAIIEILNEDGIDVTLEDIKATLGDNYAGRPLNRPLFARFLVDNGYYESISDAMRKYLGRGKRADVPRPLPEPGVVFDIIRLAGGIPFLAHPVQYRIDFLKQEAMIEDLKACGLAGIEAIYSENSPEDTERYLQLAKKHSLLITGGSDFHGSVKPGLDLGVGRGDLWVEYEVLDKLKEFMSK